MRKRMGDMRFMDFSELKKKNTDAMLKNRESRETALSKRIKRKALTANDPSTVLNNKEWCLYVMQRKINEFEQQYDKKSQAALLIRVQSAGLTSCAI